MFRSSSHSTRHTSDLPCGPVALGHPRRQPSRPRCVVLVDRRFEAHPTSHPSSSNRATRLFLSAAIIGVVAALSPDAPGPFVLLAATIFMTAMFGVVFTS
jgi:hypothetical protein